MQWADLRRWAAVLGATAMSGVVSSAWATCGQQTATIPVNVAHYRVMAAVTINGLGMPLMINTASQYSVLSPKVARELKVTLRAPPPDVEITANGRKLEAQMTTVQRLKAGSLDLKDVDFLVADVDPGLQLSGMLGRNVLAAQDTEYDISQGEIRLLAPAGGCQRGDLVHSAGDGPVFEVPLLDPEGPGDTRIRIPVDINGKPAEAMLSSGSQFTMLLPDTARAAGIADARQPLTPRNGIPAWAVMVDQLQLGTERFSRQQLEVEAVDSERVFDMALGVDYLWSHRVLVAYSERKLYATRNAFPVFRRRDGFGAGKADEQAMASAAKAMEADADSWARDAAFLSKVGVFAKARDFASRAIALRPGQASYFVTRARALRELDDWPAALKDADEALRLDPELDDARATRAYLRQRLMQPQDVLADLDVLDRRLPPDSDVRLDLVVLYRDLGRADDVLRQLNYWIESHPEDVNLDFAYNERCFLRTARNLDLQLALQDCERAVARDAARANHQDSLGWIRLRLGDLEGAQTAFDEAIRLQADQAWSLYGRSLVWMKRGDTARASEDLEAARKASPDIEQRVRDAGLPAHGAI
jgi:tetratricopeptide (TPR) repeat protein/predicted aspartyl protease